MVDCSHPFERASGTEFRITANQLNLEWRFGLACAQLALVLFFSSIALYGYVAFKLLMVVKSDGS
jgi:hypothetical protein